jgi:transporter family-2 protein
LPHTELSEGRNIMEWLVGILALFAGAAIALQPVVNAAAGDNMGHPVWGALVSAGVTFLLLAVAPVALRLPVPSTRIFEGFPPWLYSGGIIGALRLSSPCRGLALRRPLH